MDPYQQALQVREMCSSLVETIKTERDRISLSEANRLESIIRESEGWLLTARRMVNGEWE